MGSSPARSLSPTAAPSRSVFNAPSHIPAQTSIVSTRSLPTLQLEPAVADPPAVQSHCSHSRGRHVAEANRPRILVHARARRLERLTPFFLVILVVVLALALSFMFEEGVFIHPFQTEAVAQPQSHAPALSKSALTLHYGSTYIVMRNFWLEFPTEHRLASHSAPSHTLHDASHPQIQFRQGTLSTRPPSTPLVARQGEYYLPHTERVSRLLSRRASRFLGGSYYSTSALCPFSGSCGRISLVPASRLSLFGRILRKYLRFCAKAQKAHPRGLAIVARAVLRRSSRFSGRSSRSLNPSWGHLLCKIPRNRYRDDRLIQSACFLILSVRLRVLYHLMEFRIDRPSHCCASRSLLPTLEVLSSYLAHPSAAPLAFPAVHSPRVALSGDASSVKFRAAIVEICPFSWLETLSDNSLSISPLQNSTFSVVVAAELAAMFGFW
ncbi:hypothetical protein F5J12DRAFT_914612 [Pisolithus orientalis]|uniref:uncharacterized protein n=1 Tax=Pisolithus orientalis TaxID=936130 RepID=UPI0022247572|nr:uncharacterized protein F5J12DRAFT_914612 [Pisolithus orientalis]KAI5998976.1 hypothetical protein F5J12DRAFT_914612 [Pisolithus orientalis]